MAKPAPKIPWLDTRDNGVYYVFWRNKETGRTDRYSLRTKDPEEAKTSYITFLSDGKDLVRPREADISVSRALDDYELEHVNEHVVDKRRQRDAIRNLKAHFRDVPLRSVDKAASRRYRDDRMSGRTGGGKRRQHPFQPSAKNPEACIWCEWDSAHRLHKGATPAQPSTIRRELVVLIAAANHALSEKRIKHDDMPTIEMPEDVRKKAEWYRDEELKLAIRTAKGNLKKFLRILYYTGARRRAIERLTVSQVEFDIGQIDLQPTDKARTKKRNSIVPIFLEIEQDLQDLVAEAKAAGREMLFGRDMYREYAAHFEAIGLDHKANPHTMRHTRASHMLRAGVSTWKVAQLLGDTEATIVKTYGHSIPKDLAEYGGDV